MICKWIVYRWHFYETELICLYTVKWFKLLLSNTNNLMLIICLYTGKCCCKWLNSSIWLIYRILAGTTTLDQSRPGSNEGVLLIPQSSRTEASPSDGLVLYPRYLLWGWFLIHCRDAATLFYSSSFQVTIPIW